MRKEVERRGREEGEKRERRGREEGEKRERRGRIYFAKFLLFKRAEVLGPVFFNDLVPKVKQFLEKNEEEKRRKRGKKRTSN